MNLKKLINQAIGKRVAEVGKGVLEDQVTKDSLVDTANQVANEVAGNSMVQYAAVTSEGKVILYPVSEEDAMMQEYGNSANPAAPFYNKLKGILKEDLQ